MTHAEGDYEIGRKLHVRSLPTGNLCVNLGDKSCVLAMKQADFIECERNGGDSTIATILPQDSVA